MPTQKTLKKKSSQKSRAKKSRVKSPAKKLAVKSRVKSPAKKSRVKSPSKKSPSKKSPSKKSHNKSSATKRSGKKGSVIKFRFGEEESEDLYVAPARPIGEQETEDLLAASSQPIKDPDVRRAIQTYTHDSGSINKYLFQASILGDWRGESIPDKYKLLIFNLDRAMKLSRGVNPRKKDIVVYRGIKSDNPDFIDYGVFSNFKHRNEISDNVFTEAGYTSTSTSMEKALLFTAKTCCLLEITVPPESLAYRVPPELASQGEEDEVILPRNGKLVKTKPNTTVYYVITGTNGLNVPIKKILQPSEVAEIDPKFVHKFMIKHYQYVPDENLEFTFEMLIIPNVFKNENIKSLGEQKDEEDPDFDWDTAKPKVIKDSIKEKRIENEPDDYNYWLKF